MLLLSVTSGKWVGEGRGVKERGVVMEVRMVKLCRYLDYGEKEWKSKVKEVLGGMEM